MAKQKKKVNQKSDASFNKAQQGAQAAEKMQAQEKAGDGKRESRMKAERRSAAAKPSGFASGAAFAWALGMVTVFPLIWNDYYFNILETKYMTLIILSMILFTAMFLWGLVSGSLVGMFRNAGAGIRENDFFRWGRITFSATDLSVIAFYLISAIATAGAGKYVREALTGNEGRFVGFYYLQILCVAYFIVSRNLKFDSRIVTAFLLVAWLVLLFGVTDFYDMNILHFKDHMSERQHALFTSTIGNINTYTVYVGLVLALAGALFILSEESMGRTLFYFATMTLAFMALAMGSSDNGYLTLGAFFGFLPFAAFRTWRGIRRYFLTLTVFFADIAWVAHEMHTKETLEIDGLFNVIAESKYLIPLTAALGIFTAGLFVWERSRGRNAGGKAADNAAPAILWKLWGAFVIASAAFVVLSLVRANGMTMEEAQEAYGPLAAYLKFTDGWGTNRGYVWRVMFEEYDKLPLRQKITGTGPDTFAVYMAINRYQEMVTQTHQTYDSVHNEYLQYLFTIGPFGLAAYLMIIISSVAAAFRKAMRIMAGTDLTTARKYAPYLWAMGFLLICYSAQATVNITVPLVAPLVWLFVMMVQASVRGN